MERIQIAVRLDPDIYEAITQTAAREYRSANRQIDMILRQWYDDRVMAEATPTAATPVTAESKA